MDCSANLAIAILNSDPDHIAIIDDKGDIVFVNPAWTEYATTRGCKTRSDWKSVNYLNVCKASAQAGDRDSKVAVAGLHDCIDKTITEFSHCYPCHSPQQQAWFNMTVRCLDLTNTQYFVITHKNVTDSVLAHRKLKSLTVTDSLTGVANRRGFDLAFSREWRRDKRAGQHISLILLDIDCFKQFNDLYGHVAGDRCLQFIGKTVSSYARRPGDLAARYGGEEFALIMGSTFHGKASDIAHQLLQSIRNLRITHHYPENNTLLTASIGVATVDPTQTRSEKTLIKMADQALYDAKRIGRNQVRSKNHVQS